MSPAELPVHDPEMVGTRLRHLYDLLEADVASVYTDLGLPAFRPRFTPFVRALVRSGPASIGDLAAAVGVTHSAASQTLARMAAQDLIAFAPGADARQRMVRLTAHAHTLLPTLDAEWAATAAALAALETELSFPLSALIEETLAALERTPMRERITTALAATTR